MVTKIRQLEARSRKIGTGSPKVGVLIEKIDAGTSKMVSKCWDRVMEGGPETIPGARANPLRRLAPKPGKDALQIY